MRAALEKINLAFALKSLDAGEYAAFKASPLTVKLEWYEAQGLGNVSLLRGRAMGGLMKMDTLVINATERDMPLFSYDYISAMGNHTMLVEYYDTLLERAAFDSSSLERIKESISALPDHDLGEHWYDYMKLSASFAKKTKKKELPQLESAFDTALGAYLAVASAKPLLSGEQAAQKREKAAEYVEGLFKNGGPSTDAFVKAIGETKARDLFSRIVFGTEARNA